MATKMISDTRHYAEYPGGLDADGYEIETESAMRAIHKTELEHYAQPYTHRRLAFWNVRTGELLSETGDGLRITPHAPLADVLELICSFPRHLRPQTLYLIGGGHAATMPAPAWWHAPTSHGWEIEDYERKAQAATYTREKVKLYVRMSSVWFGELADEIEPRLLRETFAELRDLGRKYIDPKCTVLDTASMTGINWFQRTLPQARGAGDGRAGGKLQPIPYPAAPAALKDMLYHNATQGRMQFCPAPELVGATIPGLYVLDARWQYAACVSNLPIGIPTHDYYPDGADPTEAFIGYKPGWYRACVRVPLHWRHLGLIGDPHRGALDPNDKWPDQPGEWIGEDGGVWIGGAQLGLAIEKGWPCLIFERWVYTESESLPGANPAGEWRRRLVAMRAEAGELAAAAVREILIAAIGRWHARSRAKLQVTPLNLEHTITDNIPGLTFIDHKRKVIRWYREIPFTDAQLAYCHPEWSSRVYDSAAYRTNSTALDYPRAAILSVRSDALILAHRLPLKKPDNGRPGEWRYKPGVDGPLVTPATADAMQALRNAHSTHNAHNEQAN